MINRNGIGRILQTADLLYVKGFYIEAQEILGAGIKANPSENTDELKSMLQYYADCEKACIKTDPQGFIKPMGIEVDGLIKEMLENKNSSIELINVRCETLKRRVKRFENLYNELHNEHKKILSVSFLSKKSKEKFIVEIDEKINFLERLIKNANKPIIAFKFLGYRSR